VIHHLIDAAEEEETKEVLLAYAFLLDEPAGLTIADLDARVEHWFAATTGIAIDFEEGDAVGDLLDLGLVRTVEDRYVALPPDAAFARLDEAWDDLFTPSKEP
jgi:hypothetical protein